MKVVIVGGVAGGATAAARIRRLDEAAEIVLLERGEHISFANCGLPYYIGGEILNREELTLQTPESFRRRFRVDVRTCHEAVAIHREEKAVSVRDHRGGAEYRETYDKLLLSPGAEPVRPPLPGVDDPRIFTLRTIPDALAIRKYVEEHKPRRAVVVGGGAIGLEMVESLARAGAGVTVVERADHLAAWLDGDIACDLHHYLDRQGVRVLLNRSVKSFASAGQGLEVRLEGDNCLEADLVLLSVGVRPESGLAEAAGLEVGPRREIRVNSGMVTSDPDIYAVGDAVSCSHTVSGETVHIPLAGPANKQGRVAAGSICGLDSQYRGTQGSSVLRVFDLTCAATGLGEDAARRAGFDVDKIFTWSASHATYYPGASFMSVKTIFRRDTGRILGAQLVGFDGVDKRCDVLATAIRAEMTLADLADLELCYAPPYSSAKDPVNMIGFVGENLLAGLVKHYHWHDVDSLPRDGSVTLLDVRTSREYAGGHIDGAVNIPLDSLRDRLGELDPGKPVYVNCQSGLRSYLACRILSAHGCSCYNLEGGYRLYRSVLTGQGPKNPTLPCGAEE